MRGRRHTPDNELTTASHVDRYLWAHIVCLGRHAVSPRDRQDRATTGNLSCVPEKLGKRMKTASALAFVAAAIGLATIWVALDARSWDGLEAVIVPTLTVGATLAAGWACLLGVAVLTGRTWAKRWALFTFGAVSVLSGWAFLDTARRVVDGGAAPVRHLAAPASLFTVATTIVMLLGSAREPGRT